MNKQKEKREIKRYSSVIDPNGIEWYFVDHKCPYCGNEYPREGKCTTCTEKPFLQTIKPVWKTDGFKPENFILEEKMEALRKGMGGVR